MHGKGVTASKRGAVIRRHQQELLGSIERQDCRKETKISGFALKISPRTTAPPSPLVTEEGSASVHEGSKQTSEVTMPLRLMARPADLSEYHHREVDALLHDKLEVKDEAGSTTSSLSTAAESSPMSSYSTEQQSPEVIHTFIEEGSYPPECTTYADNATNTIAVLRQRSVVPSSSKREEFGTCLPGKKNKSPGSLPSLRAERAAPALQYWPRKQLGGLARGMPLSRAMTTATPTAATITVTAPTRDLHINSTNKNSNNQKGFDDQYLHPKRSLSQQGPEATINTTANNSKLVDASWNQYSSSSNNTLLTEMGDEDAVAKLVMLLSSSGGAGGGGRGLPVVKSSANTAGLVGGHNKGRKLLKFNHEEGLLELCGPLQPYFKKKKIPVYDIDRVESKWCCLVIHAKGRHPIRLEVDSVETADILRAGLMAASLMEPPVPAATTPTGNKAASPMLTANSSMAANATPPAPPTTGESGITSPDHGSSDLDRGLASVRPGHSLSQIYDPDAALSVAALLAKEMEEERRTSSTETEVQSWQRASWPSSPSASAAASSAVLLGAKSKLEATANPAAATRGLAIDPYSGMDGPLALQRSLSMTSILPSVETVAQDSGVLGRNSDAGNKTPPFFGQDGFNSHRGVRSITMNSITRSLPRTSRRNWKAATTRGGGGGATNDNGRWSSSLDRGVPPTPSMTDSIAALRRLHTAVEGKGLAALKRKPGGKGRSTRVMVRSKMKEGLIGWAQVLPPFTKKFVAMTEVAGATRSSREVTVNFTSRDPILLETERLTDALILEQGFLALALQQEQDRKKRSFF